MSAQIYSLVGPRAYSFVQLRLPGKLVSQCQEFSLYLGPVANQELFLKRSYLWMMLGPCCKILKACTVIDL